MDDSPEDLRRTIFTAFHTTVRGWPRGGGFYVLESCTAVDLQYLCVDRFTITYRSEDPEVEEAHCERMRRLGAWKFHSQKEYNLESWLDEDKRRKRAWLIVGFPSSGKGVWVLKTSIAEAEEKGFGSYRNAVDMNERCREIERLGGRFYESADDCADLAI